MATSLIAGSCTREKAAAQPVRQQHRTRETVATILFIILVLSAWYVSGLRQPILRWLGLPEF